MTQNRIKKFETRQKELKQMSDEELKAHFWDLCYQLVDPIVDLAKTHTSPSIERSVLLRMGIDSITAHAVVGRINEAGLLGKGAGHVVLRVSQKFNKSIPEAATIILEQEGTLDALFESNPVQGAKS